jgi:hypothetical protein
LSVLRFALTKSVKWNLSVFVEDGPTRTFSDEVKAEAVDVVSVKVLKKSGPDPTLVVAEIQPGDLDEIKFLYLQLKSGPEEGIKYNFTDNEAAPGNIADALTLDNDHVLTSGELVGLFPKAPKWIAFFNEKDQDAEVEVMVARRATPEVP